MLAHFKWIIGIQGAILHNFLSRPLYHRGLLWIMTLLKRTKDPPFRNQMADEHPRQGPGLVTPPGLRCELAFGCVDVSVLVSC